MGDPKEKFSTDRQVAALRPRNGETQTEYYHAKEPGLILRVGASRKAWVVQYTIEGKRRKFTLPDAYPALSLADAKKKYDEIRANAAKGIDPLGKRKARREAATVRDVLERYFEEVPLMPKGLSESRRMSNKDIIPLLGDMKAMDIRRHHVRELHSIIVKRGATVAANRTVELLRRAYSHAYEEELIDANPFPSIKKIKAQEAERDRILRDDEIKALWEAMEKESLNMRDILRLLLLIGQRSTDTMSMKVSDIDIDRREWTVPAPPRAKNAKPNVIPLPPMAWEIIEPRLNNEKWIFPSVRNQTREFSSGEGRTASTKDARRRLREGTGIAGWTGHDLRRTCRTIMSREGVKPHIAERVLGHVQGGVEGIYDRYEYITEKAQALEKVERHIKRILDITEQCKIVALKIAG